MGCMVIFLPDGPQISGFGLIQTCFLSADELSMDLQACPCHILPSAECRKCMAHQDFQALGQDIPRTCRMGVNDGVETGTSGQAIAAGLPLCMVG